jgi:hypothetical protein
MESTVHIRIGHSTEELGILRTELRGGHAALRNLREGGSINLENLVLLPLRLIFLLDSDKGISFLGLYCGIHILAPYVHRIVWRRGRGGL